MKKPLKNNQRRKLLSRQHTKMSARRLSHFKQTMTSISGSEQITPLSQ